MAAAPIRRRALEHYEPVPGALAPSLGSLDAAEEHATGLSVRSGLSNRRENVGAEDRQELPNASQEHLHVFAVRFGKLRAASLEIRISLAEQAERSL